ncbi:MAG: hypothetical protein ACKPKO_30745, partial [Candidatus Fonsibacter sp.]
MSEAQRTPSARKPTIMSLSHIASMQLDQAGNGQGVTWWSRVCFADREAIIMLDSNDAGRLLVNADLYTRPPTPKFHPFLATSDAALTDNRRASQS